MNIYPSVIIRMRNQQIWNCRWMDLLPIERSTRKCYPIISSLFKKNTFICWDFDPRFSREWATTMPTSVITHKWKQTPDKLFGRFEQWSSTGLKKKGTCSLHSFLSITSRKTLTTWRPHFLTLHTHEPPPGKKRSFFLPRAINQCALPATPTTWTGYVWKPWPLERRGEIVVCGGPLEVWKSEMYVTHCCVTASMWYYCLNFFQIC